MVSGRRVQRRRPGNLGCIRLSHIAERPGEVDRQTALARVKAFFLVQIVLKKISNS